MHVLHLIDRLAVGGAERMLVDLANQTVSDGYRVSVCITREGGELTEELRSEIELLELRRQRRFDWNALRRLGRFVQDREVDILHVHGRSTFSLVSLARMLGLLCKPALLHDHCGIEMDRSVPGWFRVAARRYLDRYVGVYRQLGEWAITAGVEPDRIHVIGNALDLERLDADGREASGSAAGPVQRNGLLGITVAGIREEKGTDTLLKAVAQLPSDVVYSLLVVGGAADATYTGRCRGLCAELGIQDRVAFLGLRRDVPALLRQADFAVMPSRSESGPLVLIEYMAFGIPFVSTRVGDVSHRAEQLGLGEFVPPDDPAAVAVALERLLRLSGEERRCRGREGQRVARQYFDIRAVAPEWYGLYEQMGRV